MINEEWNSKKNKLFFKGTTAGCGTKLENNLRIRLGKLVSVWNEAPDTSIKKNILDINLLAIDKEDLIYMNKYLSFQETNHLDEHSIILSKKEDKIKQGINYKYLLYEIKTEILQISI